MADEQRSFADRWMDLLPESANIEDRRNDPYRGSVSLYRKNDRGIYNIPPAPNLPGPGPGQGDMPMGLLGALLPFMPGGGLVPRDTPEMLASKKERANKMRGAYNDFFDTPGQKAAMENKNVTPLTPGDNYYNSTLNFTDPNKSFVQPANKEPWWLGMAKQLGGMPADGAAQPPPQPTPPAPAAPAPQPQQQPPGPPMSLAPPNPGPSSGPGVVPPQRMASAVTGNPDLPNMVDPSQLPQQGLFARTVMDPNTGGMMNDFATKRPGDDLASIFRSLIGK